MTRQMHVGLEDRPNNLHGLAEFYAERARGGAAPIVTGGFAPAFRHKVASCLVNPRAAHETLPALSVLPKHFGAVQATAL